MLLTNRRHRLLFGALAGMELSWLLPFVLLFLHFWISRSDAATANEFGATQANAQLASLIELPAPVLLLFFWLIMIVYMLAADALNRSLVESPLREFLLFGLILGTSLLSARLLLYPAQAPLDGTWVGNFFNALFNFHRGRRPELALLLVNLLLWFRVAALTGRELSFFSVGFSFRLGLLLAIFGAGLLNYLLPATRPAGTSYLFLFFAFGLTAVALARMDEKALYGAESRGAHMPWPRLGQIVGAAGLILGGAWLVAQLYTPTTLRAVLGWFSPLWNFLGVLASRLLFGLAWLLAPLLERMIAFLRRLFELSGLFDNPAEQEQVSALPEATPLASIDLGEFFATWSPIRYALVLAVLMVALGIIWFFFLRTTGRAVSDEAEEIEVERLEVDGGLLERGLQKLRDWADLVRRYGLGAQLLAAVSVQNIYANIVRLARVRGYPRAPALPPDQYLPQLRMAFPGCEDELQQITEAYMRVEYGDRPADEPELAELRRAFQRVQAAAPPLPPPNSPLEETGIRQ